VPPVEAWQKVFIDREAYFEQDVHSYINCTTCHAGQNVDDMDAAHEGMIADPAADPEAGCGDCHPDIAPYAADSLHFTLQGYDTAIYQRSSPENHPTLEHMESYHCSACHATCGDCHVSQPNAVGGGFLEGHVFVQTPPMSRTCTACHGSRVKNEYYGLNEGYPGDVHLRQGRMACEDCHDGAQMHGIDPNIPLDEDRHLNANHRYNGDREPKCESCHEDEIGVGSGILEHEIHGTELMSCQVCHSVSYTNCKNCHVDKTEDDVPFYTVEDHWLGFFIGRNPLQNNERPYRYVTVRHVPVDINSFDKYGDNLLDQFLSRPTWEYATPHNIQRNTPQTESCDSCHGNDEFFLTPDKLAQYGLDSELGGANLDVVVEHAPPLPENADELVERIKARIEAEGGTLEGGGMEAEGAQGGEELSGDEAFWGGGEEENAPAENADESFWGGGEEENTDQSAESADDAFWGGGDEGGADNTENADDVFWGGN